MSPTAVRRGLRVRIPWGVRQTIPAEVVEVWGRPPEYARVLLWPDRQPDDDDPDPTVILLRVDLLQPA